MIYDLDFKNEKEINAIRKYLKDNYLYSEYTQSIEWNIIRNEKIKYLIYFKDELNNILWSCSLFEKEKNNQKYLYSSRGPVLNYDDGKIINHFFENIKNWLKEKGYTKLVINPCINFTQLNHFPNNLNLKVKNKNDYDNLLDSCKLAIMNITFDEEKLINQLPAKFRQNTRRSYRKNLSSRISNIIDYANFYKLYLDTANRHDFKPHTLDYFKNIYKQFKDNLIFIEVWYKDKPLAMSIDIIYNNKLIYLYGVSSSENRNLLGMYNLQWEAIKYCIDHKISKYDFGGVFCQEDDINNKDYGLYTFKKGYCNNFIDIVPDIEILFEEEKI